MYVCFVGLLTVGLWSGLGLSTHVEPLKPLGCNETEAFNGFESYNRFDRALTGLRAEISFVTPTGQIALRTPIGFKGFQCFKIF